MMDHYFLREEEGEGVGRGWGGGGDRKGGGGGGGSRKGGSQRVGRGWRITGGGGSRYPHFSVGGFLQQCGVAEVVGLHDGGVQRGEVQCCYGKIIVPEGGGQRSLAAQPAYCNDTR